MHAITPHASIHSSSDLLEKLFHHLLCMLTVNFEPVIRNRLVNNSHTHYTHILSFWVRPLTTTEPPPQLSHGLSMCASTHGLAGLLMSAACRSSGTSFSWHWGALKGDSCTSFWLSEELFFLSSFAGWFEGGYVCAHLCFCVCVRFLVFICVLLGSDGGET